MSSRVKVNYGGPFREVLNSGGTRAFVTERAARVLAQAKSQAPVDTGAYQASLHIEQATTDRAVARVVASVPYAHIVEARSGVLARSIDAAGGS